MIPVIAVPVKTVVVVNTYVEALNTYEVAYKLEAWYSSQALVRLVTEFMIEFCNRSVNVAIQVSVVLTG